MRPNTTLAIGLALLVFACRNESRSYSAGRAVDAAVTASNPRDSGGASSSNEAGGPAGSATGGRATDSEAPPGQSGDAEGPSGAELDGGDAESDTPAHSTDGGQTPGPVCSAGQEFCLGNTVRLCSVDGLSSEEQAACSDTQYCDTDTAKCTDGVCAPNLPTCYRGAPAVCNTVGSAFVATGTECTSTQTCLAGDCAPHVCVPNDAFCQAGDVVVCTADGLAADLLDTCEAGEYCDADSCVPDVCSAGAVGCGTGEQPQICNPEGSNWDDSGAACQGLTPHCLSGACVACTPEATECTGSVPRVCSSDGSWVAQAACTDPKPVCDAATATCEYEDSRDVAGIVACGELGETVCDVTAGEACCIREFTPALVYVHACGVCGGGGGSESHGCDADDDCPSGDVCCYHHYTDGFRTQCESDCDSSTGSTSVCIPGETPCPSGQTCTLVLTEEFGIGRCL